MKTKIPGILLETLIAQQKQQNARRLEVGLPALYYIIFLAAAGQCRSQVKRCTTARVYTTSITTIVM